MKKADFKKLQAKWYKKLADTGFQDIEDLSRYYEPLKTWDSFLFKGQYTPEQFAERAKYFQRCERALSLHKFKTKLEKEIWTLHTQGHTVREIVKALKARRFKCYKTGVFTILKRLQKDLQWY